ncbi:MAG: two-component system response regulator [Candidatus Nealsonbacteria bacterium CG23_combo_of_CG06-09_8_20_14_all_40_13]|uniref:Two-component system response regulator n=1 Tax=Candidatus Nealsonbacteria bacterium CG23_combo_of_CG06-09_8_20_14_all_40_13 TaxID=1974724 RepID=A0A2G9YSV8_9BACT|nr:MAG: two-component system response regulator [Candidatus Nealsonbacteria bacterium CG23_combo_of_CG06-09_8_20_14_all_40_13]PIR70814.1 MAG: two-component system response regulator [Candidatus Nealsonbacteria bacterium CG10_big_fil_rev_8_21_14_0_10_40_24]PIU43333.1 MAG: two-component system response regulator [Candidatus Nealsonbacteria bacterium CG07_land_8_20_14_0_80_40_10]
MKVLIIDDEETILKMYGTKLSMAKIEVLTSEDGQKGIEMAAKEKPDVILLDIIMPNINGLDVLKMLKIRDETKNIPVYLLTNLPQEASGEKAKELGAAGYMVKAEFEPQKLLEKIQSLPNNDQ